MEQASDLRLDENAVKEFENSVSFLQGHDLFFKAQNVSRLEGVLDITFPNSELYEENHFLLTKMQEASTILAVHTGLTRQKVDVDLVRKCNETTKKNLTNNLNEFKKRTFECISQCEEKIRKLESEVTSIRKDLKKEKEERAKWCNEVASLLILQGIDTYVKEKGSNITQSFCCNYSKELIQNNLDLMEKAESLKKVIKSFPEKLKKSSIQDLIKTEMTEDELEFCKLINVNFNNFVNYSLDNEGK